MELSNYFSLVQDTGRMKAFQVKCLCISRSKTQREFNRLDDETVIQNTSPLP